MVQFQPGNKDGKQFSSKYQPEVHNRLKKSDFKGILREMVEKPATAQRLWHIFQGYKGVRASESREAFKIMAAYGIGKLK